MDHGQQTLGQKEKNKTRINNGVAFSRESFGTNFDFDRASRLERDASLACTLLDR